MDQRIIEAKQMVKDRIVLYNKTVSEVRAECKHCFVIERKGYYSEFGTHHPTIRICADCGLEEQGDAYASSNSFVKLTSEFIKQDDYSKYRLYDLDKENEFKRVRYGEYLKPESC